MDSKSKRQRDRINKKKKKLEILAKLLSEKTQRENQVLEKTQCVTVKNSNGSDSLQGTVVSEDPPGKPSAAGQSVLPQQKQSLAATSTKAMELKELRKQARVVMRDAMDPPVFSLTECGSNAQVSLLALHQRCQNPLFMKDIRDFLIFSVLGNITHYKPRWCTILRVIQVKYVVFLVVEGASTEHIVKFSSCFPRCKRIFGKTLEVHSPAIYKNSLLKELVMLPDGHFGPNKRACSREAAALVTVNGNVPMEALFPVRTAPSEDLTQGMGLTIYDKFPRTHLLLNLYQMSLGRFPLPSAPGDSKAIFTKEAFLPVTPSSPMFAIDCEMCLTVCHEKELTRVSIVNEQLECVYDSYVKPRNRITDYLTKFSGVTPMILQDVTTRLEDVHQDIRSILPHNAILVGHSLDCDLKALKLMHPYVIDTSVIYNLSGVYNKKSKLCTLAKELLGEEIQTSGSGHSSIEDSMSAMKLVQLKLKHDREYGNALMGGFISLTSEPKDAKVAADAANKEGSTETNSGAEQTTDPPPVTTANTISAAITGLYSAKQQATPSTDCNKRKSEDTEDLLGVFTSVFHHTNKWKKQVNIVGTSSTVEELTSLIPVLPEMPGVSTVTVETNHVVSKSVRELAGQRSLTLGVLDMKQALEEETDTAQVKESLVNLDRRIGKLYSSLEDDALLVVLLGGASRPLQRSAVHPGMAMVKLKT